MEEQNNMNKPEGANNPSHDANQNASNESNNSADANDYGSISLNKASTGSR